MPAALYTQVYGARYGPDLPYRKGECSTPCPNQIWNAGGTPDLKKSFILYHDQYDSISCLSAEQKACLLDSFFAYNMGEEMPDMDPVCKMAFSFFKSAFDRDASKYLKRCEKNRENIIKRWDTNVYERIQSNTNDTKHTDTDTDTDTDISTGSSDEQPIDKFFKPKPKACSDEQWEKYLTFSRKFLEGRFEELGALAQVKDSKIVASAKALDNLIRVQGFDKKTVKETIEWAVKDSFWSVQVRSLGGLTEKKSNGEMKFNNILAARLRQVRDAG